MSGQTNKKMTSSEKDSLIMQLNNNIKILGNMFNELNHKVTIMDASIAVSNVLIDQMITKKEFLEVIPIREDELEGFLEGKVAENYIVIYESLIFNVKNSKLYRYESLIDSWECLSPEGIIDPTFTVNGERKFIFKKKFLLDEQVVMAKSYNEAAHSLHLRLIKNRQDELSNSNLKTA